MQISFYVVFCCYLTRISLRTVGKVSTTDPLRALYDVINGRDRRDATAAGGEEREYTTYYNTWGVITIECYGSLHEKYENCVKYESVYIL